MNTKQLVEDAKIRFSHNASKIQLEEKYKNRLMLADQGGLWLADSSTISLLSNFTTEEIVMIDTFKNPVKVKRIELLHKLTEKYQEVMTDKTYLESVLNDGKERAKAIADRTLAEVKAALGFSMPTA